MATAFSSRKCTSSARSAVIKPLTGGKQHCCMRVVARFTGAAFADLILRKFQADMIALISHSVHNTTHII
jgi:hypothetical protein